jgi:type IV secretory pathway ATPase VirB11/archaellum biosynthesis ATPase
MKENPTMKELIENALQFTPEKIIESANIRVPQPIIVGEIREESAKDFIEALAKSDSVFIQQ